MSLAYIRRFYGVPAKRGAYVEYIDKRVRYVGTITGSSDAYIVVKPCHEPNKRKLFHPADENVKYLSEVMCDD